MQDFLSVDLKIKNVFIIKPPVVIKFFIVFNFALYLCILLK